MKPEKLDRAHAHEMNAHPSDLVHLSTDSSYGGTQSIVWRDPFGNDVLKIYGVSYIQLEKLYRDIQLALGKPPEPVIPQLIEIYEAIGKLIPQSEEDDDLYD